MLKSVKNQAGFTLIELLVVVIIVAVLAAVGVPLLAGNVDRAKTSEALAGLGVLRTGLRAEFAEKGNYLGRAGLAANDATVQATLNIKAGDLTGRYFEDDDYIINSVAGAPAVGGNPAVNASYCLRVTGDAAGNATKGSEVVNVTRSMNQNGDIFASADCGVANGDAAIN